MNYEKLSIYCDISPHSAIEVDLPTIADYLAFLYKVARTGGHTTEEEIFVENLAVSIDIEPPILKKAVIQSQNLSESIREAAAKLDNTPLRENAYLDACRLTRLDSAVTAEERFALNEAEAGLNLKKDFIHSARDLARSQEKILHIFCLLADRPDPADLWTIYLTEGLRQSDRQRRIILPDPASTQIDERISVLALILKLVGVGWRRSAEDTIIQSLAHYLELSDPQKEQAMNEAWMLKSSLLSITSKIKTRPLQLVALGDAYRVCLSDTQICDFERTLLNKLTDQFDLDPVISKKFIELTYNETAFRDSLRQLNRPSVTRNK